MSYCIVGVHLLSLPFHADKEYSYYVPFALQNEPKRGSLAVVPFGGANKRLSAVVSRVYESESIENLKPVLSFNSYVSLTEEEIKLCEFLARHYFCSVGDAVRSILPPGILTNISCFYRLSGKAVKDQVSEDAYRIMDLLFRDNELSDEKLLKSAGIAAYGALEELIAKGIVERIEKQVKPTNEKVTETVDLAITEEEYLALHLRGARQTAIVNHLHDYGASTLNELKDVLKVTRAHLNPLIESGIVKIEKEPNWRGLSDVPVIEKRDELSESQTRALNEICAHLTGKPEAVLFHGVTGSGKTQVMMRVMDKVLASGRQVIMLVPEIALTPQTLQRFRSVYGNRIAVCHSSLSAGERYDAWRRMKNGEADICIGTRSAIFAPFDNLGLIVIDEEHEHTYKSEQTPRYNAKEVASFRCGCHNAMLLLASATPSIESYYKAKTGVYTLVELNERYGNAILPNAMIADLKLDRKNGSASPIGMLLKQNLESVLENDKQAIFFINRRGYSNFLTCPLCGESVTCPHCSVAMTHHTKKSRLQNHLPYNEFLMCHYCGYTVPVPDKCPSCASGKLTFVGYGTQKAQEALENDFEGIRTLRMDADTTTSRYDFDNILTDFRQRKADVLIGTQMVTKGHDFPAVTLVGVLLADASLYMDDYRSNERTFSLITQVIGRAGRADDQGCAVIQTYNPEHPVILKAAAQDYKAFYEDEIRTRKTLVFPPFCDIAMISFSSEDETELANACVSFSNACRNALANEYNDVAMSIFGPFEAPIYRINETYRKRLIIKCKNNARTREMLSKIIMDFTKFVKKHVTVSVDMNPNTV